MKNFEWLLEKLGWEQVRLGCDNPRCICNGHIGWKSLTGEELKMGYIPTYDFIRSIPIEDWIKYGDALVDVLIDEHKLTVTIGGEKERLSAVAFKVSWRLMRLFHNASLDARIEAHCRAKGME